MKIWPRETIRAVYAAQLICKVYKEQYVNNELIEFKEAFSPSFIAIRCI